MSSEKLRNIRYYLFRHGRYLDCALWNYYFEDGPAFDVLRALKAFQNDDGGFGHGLEPDNQNPHSTPLSSWVAVRILRGLGFPPLAGSMIGRLLRYLDETTARRGDLWTPTVASNADYPHAPWWDHAEDGELNYNPSAELASFIIRTGEPGTALYERAERIVGRAAADVTEPAFVPEAHELSNLVAMAGDLAAAGRTDLLPAAFQSRLLELVTAAVESVPLPYKADGYWPKPSDYISSQTSPFFAGLAERCRAYADYLEASAEQAGYWNVGWTWGEAAPPDEVLRQWKSALTVENMLFLQAMKPESA